MVTQINLGKKNPDFSGILKLESVSLIVSFHYMMHLEVICAKFSEAVSTKRIMDTIVTSTQYADEPPFVKLLK